MPTPLIERLAAFSQDPAGGNPAGVVLADAPMDPEAMQRIAADVGYSETAFAWPTDGGLTVRYFSPIAEVPFCGHATIALGAVLAGRTGPTTHRFHTRAGLVTVEADRDPDGPFAALTSVEPSHREAPDGLVDDVLEAFGWGRNHLAPGAVPVIAFAGAHHLLLEVRSRPVLAAMAYDFERVRTLMLDRDLTTVALLWQRSPEQWHVRNAFPVGGVIEDPATGAAAAAFGGWLRATGRVTAPALVMVLQGEDMGRPSRLDVSIPPAGGIRVAGRAVRLDA